MAWQALDARQRLEWSVGCGAQPLRTYIHRTLTALTLRVKKQAPDPQGRRPDAASARGLNPLATAG